MSEAFKDELTNESDVLKTCDMGGSLYVETFPSLLSTPETFPSCSHSSQAAGQQAVSSSAVGGDGAQRSLTRGNHREKGFASEQCLS